ncbi:hypothetical protein EV363DRAFT_790277 [Boletus edulis]|uniref:Uncharacterized protein n=1 Tax=Boletus edulis BED1 TaxID=1328754 RepID=A0AAD4G7E7_BOLED|nr:hypothetical protein EV363DRAFT_790277 [Boletus edulis]KAF8423161.1 hypothetical protein L210DRAFT_176670 [Boletus edulis BED1]
MPTFKWRYLLSCIACEKANRGCSMRSVYARLVRLVRREPIACMNNDCPWLYERTKAEQKMDFLEGLRMLIEDLDVS